MKKANSKIEDKPIAEIAVSDEQIGRIKELLRFPVTAESRDKRKQLQQMEYNIKSYGDTVGYHENELTTYRGRLRNERLALFKLARELSDTPVSLEDAKSIFGQVAKLPWVEKITLDGSYLYLTTRKDMLKTVFDVQMVGIGGGSHVLEFLEGPVSASMPEYEIRISLTNMGSAWATNESVLALRFSNQEDIANFDGKGIMARQMIAPHWASNGTNEFDRWQYLCLGEYEGDLTKASAQGLIPFLTELALYLQLSGDQHAYRPKPVWALMIGKKEYSEFNGRVLREGETAKMVKERYARDYKLLRQPEGAREVVLPAVQVPENQQINRAMNILRNMQRMTDAIEVPLDADTAPVEECDCDLMGETDPDLLLVCDCTGTCDCHHEALEPVTVQEMMRARGRFEDIEPF